MTLCARWNLGIRTAARATICSAVLTLLGPATVQAAFVEVDDFEGLTLGALNGQNGWTTSNAGFVVAADPVNGLNSVMRITSGTPSDQTAYKAIPGIVNSSTAATLFFRARKDAGVVNMSWGASDVATPTVNFGDYETQFNIQDTSSNTLQVRNGSNFGPVDAFADNVWYDLWMVIDNNANTYEAYIQGGAFGSVTQLDLVGPVTEFGFRNGGANDLIRALIRNGANHNANFYIDDVYLDLAGQNLANPSAVPEPSTWLLLGLSSLGLYVARRRKYG